MWEILRKSYRASGFVHLQYIFSLAKNREVVFSDIIKANLIFGVCLFCIFVKNTIYAL